MGMATTFTMEGMDTTSILCTPYQVEQVVFQLSCSVAHTASALDIVSTGCIHKLMMRNKSLKLSNTLRQEMLLLLMRYKLMIHILANSQITTNRLLQTII